MPSWNSLLDEIRTSGSTFDIVRRKYLTALHDLTGRNVIAYYSGWLQRPGVDTVQIGDQDKVGFMSNVHGLDRTKGLDLLLHTPGGDTAATQSLVDYLRNMFGTNIRAVVPQLAMSAGTMIACSCSSILMGKQSSLGPIDPQFGGLPAHGILEEFDQAHKECRADPSKIHVWQPVIAKYHPTLIGECQKAIAWSEEMVQEWLISGMLSGQDNAADKAESIVKELGDHAITKSHARHLSADKCQDIGLQVERLEDSPELQEAVLTVHHAFIHTMSASATTKIIENHNGTAFIQSAQTVPQR